MALAAALALEACAGAGTGRRLGGLGVRYPGLSCAPFARALTGVDLHGDAATWWAQAGARYRRARQPEVGAILVLAATGRLPHGHVAVVSRVVGVGRIEVIQANWVPSELALHQPVIDVSPTGDWSLVRVWYPPIAAMGGYAYAAHGFIIPDRATSAGMLAAGAARAAAAAAGS